MLSNVGEIVWDGYSYNSPAGVDPVVPPSADLSVRRGGTHYMTDAFSRSGSRHHDPFDMRNHGTGFRVTLDVAATPE